MKRKGSVLIEVLVSSMIFFLSLGVIVSGLYLLQVQNQRQYEKLCCSNICYTISYYYQSDSNNWLIHYTNFDSEQIAKITDNIQYSDEFQPQLEPGKYQMNFKEESNHLILDFIETESSRNILSQVEIKGQTI